MRNSSPRRLSAYGPAARVLHWTSAALVLLLALSGVIMTLDLAADGVPARLRDVLPLYDLHKAMGVLVLALTILRLVHRLLHGAPEIDPALPGWQRRVAEFVHGWIYLLLLLVPALGWLGISLYPALNLFGTLPLPGLVAPDRALSAGVFLAHAIAAFTLMTLAAVHVAAALHHHFVRRDATLRRMLGHGEGG